MTRNDEAIPAELSNPVDDQPLLARYPQISRATLIEICSFYWLSAIAAVRPSDLLSSVDTPSSMAPSKSWPVACLTFSALVLLHLTVSPYTKVEESFNIQATHDILTYGVPTTTDGLQLKAQYDHMTFPGAVPRTFLGSLVLAAAANPWVQYGHLNGEQQQLLGKRISRPATTSNQDRH